MELYSPNPGFDWNPMRKFRNIPCFCGSKLKAKRCHGRLDALPHDVLPKVKAYLRMLSAAGFIEVRSSEIT